MIRYDPILPFRYRCAATEPFSVAPHAFRPRPQVHSSVIGLVPLPAATPVSDPALFGQRVRHACGRRRKTFHNARGRLDEGGFGRARIDPMLRPDALAVADVVRLTNELASARCAGPTRRIGWGASRDTERVEEVRYET